MTTTQATPPTENPNHAGSVLSTIGRGGRRIWQYPVWFRGKLITLRSAMHAVLVVALLLGPWIDLAGHPAIRFDIPNRRAYLWGLQFFATDGVYLVLVLGSLLFLVFLFTALFGRAWCGWTCPQTVFMESVYRPIERLIEGTPMQRKRRDAGPWTPDRIFKKVLKFSAFLTISGAIGTTFVAYFLGREGVVQSQSDPFSHPVGTAIFIAITGFCMFDFGFFREQICLVACPYGRFQSVLLDQDSIGVGYDFRRGEPRGKVKKAGKVSLPIVTDAAPQGDCVECQRCTQVCPTGIDIRNGAQMECIQCMACIDACNDVMAKLKRPPGLIRLDSERVFGGGKRRTLRPRVVAYFVGLLAAVTALTLTISQHASVEFNLGRQSGAPYVELPNGKLQNAYRLRISNKEDGEKSFSIAIDEPAGATFFTPVSPLLVPGGAVEHFPVFVMVDRQAAGESVVLSVTGPDGVAQKLRVPFLSPQHPTANDAP